MDWYRMNILINTQKYNKIYHIINTRKFIDAHTNQINWIY